MEPIRINTASSIYPIYIENSFSRLPAAFQEAGLTGRKICVVTDSNVAPLYLRQVIDALAGSAGTVSTVQFEAGENHKHLETVSRFYDVFLANKLDRKSVVVALGGGVTGDMAGFAAATYMRGISFVQIPTTLLSQVDAGVGGKTGVDYRGVKNLIGAFYQPHFVYMNIHTLSTLPEEEFQSGMGEVIKHGLLDNDYNRFLHTHKAAIRARESEALRDTAAGSCRVKAAVVSQDERETASGLRETLNLGHTFGHAVESLCEYTLPHGVCVGIGLCAALHLSVLLGGASQALLDETEALLTYFGLPTRAPELDPDVVYAHMLTDKKTHNDHLRLILIDEQNRAYTNEQAPKDTVMEAINRMIRG